MKPIKVDNIYKALSLLLHNTYRYELPDGTIVLMPNLYRALSQDKIDEMWSKWGCGPGGVGDYFVPDSILGIPITPA